MKLNKDCVRDILLFIEDNYIPGKEIYFNDIIQALSKSNYSEIEINYALSKLSETPYTSLKLTQYNGLILDGTSGALTWEGHEFLDNIRSKTVWEKVKTTIKENFGDVSIKMMATLAEIYIKNKLH